MEEERIENSYIDGSAVRWAQPEAAPAVAEPAAQPQPELPEQPGSRKNADKQHKPSAGKARRRSIELPYLAFLSVATALLLVSCVQMLSVKAKLTNTQNSIEKLNVQLQEARSTNDSKELYLEKSLDLDEIYRTATEEYGMVYPSEDQIITYTRTEKGYVRQYEDIPTE